MEKPEKSASSIETPQSASPFLYQPDRLPLFAAVEDLRWKVLLDRDGERIGTIETVEADEETDRVEFLQVGRGGFLGFGAERFLVPITQIIEVDEKTVKIAHGSTVLEGVPPFDYERLDDAEYCECVRSWWLQAEGPAETATSTPA